MNVNIQMNLDLKDWLLLVGVAVTFCTFLYRLRVDMQLARYRETISFIEKREKDMHEAWAAISNFPAGSLDWSTKLKIFFGRLELVALMVRKKGFDSEIVYSFWWKYFYEPLCDTTILAEFEAFRNGDLAVFEQYSKLSRKWTARVKREQARVSK